MTWVVALILVAVALPVLLARLAGGYPPEPGPELAALAPLAVVPAVAAVIVAGFAAWWLAAVLAFPAALLVSWQLPPLGRARFRAAAGPSPGTGSAAATLRLRLFTVNARWGAADPAAILGIVRRHDVDVLAVQELTAPMARRLAAAGLTGVLPFSHLEPRPGSGGAGLWARWPPAMSRRWWRGISMPPGITGRSGNCWRPASWTAPMPARPGAGPGFTWPSLPVMRLDHVLVSGTAI